MIFHQRIGSLNLPIMYLLFIYTIQLSKNSPSYLTSLVEFNNKLLYYKDNRLTLLGVRNTFKVESSNCELEFSLKPIL